ncbi:hypothetical protein [Pseudonocardia endophytica]|nr:hypothetical protein [Pseudonocardia endophytica]
MLHARTARATATAAALRSSLLDAVGETGGIDVGALQPETWFDNLRVSVDGTVMDAADAVVERLATHSAPMRAFVASAIGSDPGEPHNLEAVRVHVDSEVATIRFRDHSTRLRLPHRLPAWVDEGSLTAFRHRRAESA